MTQMRKVGMRVLAVAAVTGVALGGSTFADQQSATSAATTATAGEIANNPAKFYGKKVTVRAEVEDVLSRQVFLLDEDKLFVWPDVLVIAPPMSSAVPEDEVVTVTGMVRSFVDADFRREYDWDWWGDLDTDIVVAFRERPVILADSVRTQAGTELVKPR